MDLAAIDAHVVRLLAAEDPWVAYDETQLIGGILAGAAADHGDCYVAWMELGDLYETGRTPIADAHQVVTGAARDWLGRGSPRAPDHFAQWAERSRASALKHFDRDGDFWSDRS